MLVKEFECYGPNGLQIVISALTDNTNRTISNLNGYLSKLHGEIAKPNSAKIFFDYLGYIVMYKDNFNLDKLLELTFNHNVVDIIEQEDAFEIKTTVNDFYKIKGILINNGAKIFNAEVRLLPKNPIESLDSETKARLEKFIDACDQDDDIQ
jgi:transcriptional/translational regulatory protein YebC/TACO1